MVTPLTDFDVWAKRMMQDRLSPAAAASGDLTQAWEGAEGAPANVVVRVPRTAGKATVTIAPPEADADATPLFQAAFAKLRAQGGGILKVAPGDYTFKTAQSGHILISKLTDVDIQAAGARFAFMTNADGIFIQDCQRVRIQGASLRENGVLSGTGRMRMAGGVLRLELDQPLPEGAAIHWVQPMNETSHTWPQMQARAIIAPSTAQPLRLDARTFTSPEFRFLSDGQYVAVKFTYYGNRSVYVRDSNTGINEDIVLDGLHIGTTGGMGVLVKTRGRGVALLNSTISADPGRPYSTNYDGLHVVAASGDILIRGNTLSHIGDDPMNLRSIIHKATPVTTDSVTLTNDARLIRVGDEVAFFNKDGEYLSRRVVKSAPPIGNSDTITFGLAAGEPFGEAAYARVVNITPRRFAVVDNVIANNSGRGMLAQIPVGLVQNNVFRGLPRTAIRLITSFNPWMEGAGAIDVRITGNRIENGGGEVGFTYASGIIGVMGELVTAKVAPNLVHGPIKIDGNTFTAPRTACIVIFNTKGLVQQGNTCG